MTDAELTNRYSYHAPAGDQVQQYATIRAGVLTLARLIVAQTPESRDQTRALNALDEVMFLANAAIARNYTIYVTPDGYPRADSPNLYSEELQVDVVTYRAWNDSGNLRGGSDTVTALALIGRLQSLPASAARDRCIEYLKTRVES